MKPLKGCPVAKDVRVAIVGSCFNSPIADKIGRAHV